MNQEEREKSTQPKPKLVSQHIYLYNRHKLGHDSIKTVIEYKIIKRNLLLSAMRCVCFFFVRFSFFVWFRATASRWNVCISKCCARICGWRHYSPAINIKCNAPYSTCCSRIVAFTLSKWKRNDCADRTCYKMNNKITYANRYTCRIWWLNGIRYSPPLSHSARAYSVSHRNAYSIINNALYDIKSL